MKRSFYLFVFSLILVCAGPAHADLIGTITHDYGSGVGKIDPGGNDVLSDDYVNISDNSTSRFSDDFDFSGLSYNNVSSFELTLRFRDTDDGFWEKTGVCDLDNHKIYWI